MSVATVVLHQFPGIPGLASVSPFCEKVHYALHLKQLDYQTRDVIFAKRVSPSGKLPALAIDGLVIEDSTAILRALDDLAPEPPLYPREPRARALAHVLEDWADETLRWYVVHYRWARPANFARIRPHFLAQAPWPVRLLAPYVARRRIAKALRAVGIGQRAHAVVDAEFEAHLDTLDALVGGGFVTGDTITAADLAIAAQLQMLRVGFTPDEETRIANHAPASAWLERVAIAVS